MSDLSSREGSKPIYKIKVEKDVYVKMRDGVRLAVDIYRPDAPGNFPALLSMHPYCKDIEELNLPRPVKGLIIEFVIVEAGDHEFWASRGYTHVIADVRGTGKSEGEFCNLISEIEQQDGYDLVEWIAQQPWCNGNVGMLGISYLAFTQYLVAAKQPPHLKAIFPHDGWADTYRDIMYHGGIPSIFFQIMQNIVAARKAVPASKTMYSEEELNRRVEELKKDEAANINKNPLLYTVLTLPEVYPISFDFLLNQVDGPFYWERCPAAKMDKIKIPTYLGSSMHTKDVTMHLPGAVWGWERIEAPKKLAFRPDVTERPFHEFHDEILRWYDYWLKGIDTGIMDEPPVKIWVRGAERWRYEHEWPLLSKTKWTKYYLRKDNLLEDNSAETEEPPDRFNYKPALPAMLGIPISPKPEYITYATQPFKQDIEITGPIALYLHASLSSDDGDFIVVVKDVNPDGSGFSLTRGWLKASHREVDKDKSKPWKPHHPHTSPVPVTPGEVNEYAIGIQPISNLFKAGHKIQLEIWPCDYPAESYHDWTLYWGCAHHIPYGKEATYEIHHTPEHPSHILLPFTKP